MEIKLSISRTMIMMKMAEMVVMIVKMMEVMMMVGKLQGMIDMEVEDGVEEEVEVEEEEVTEVVVADMEEEMMISMKKIIQNFSLVDLQVMKQKIKQENYLGSSEKLQMLLLWMDLVS